MKNLIFSVLVITNLCLYSQENNKNYFIAIFKDTLIELTEKNEKEIGIDIAEKEIRMMIAKDSINSLSSTKDLIYTFDTTIAGRRCYGTIFSGSTLASVLRKQFSDNIIYLYVSDMHISRMFNGLFIFNSEDVKWEFRMKAE